MKKRSNEINFLKPNYIEKDKTHDKIKTTNINILLNRVRIQNKKNILKKVKISLFIVFLLFVTSIITSLL